MLVYHGVLLVGIVQTCTGRFIDLFIEFSMRFIYEHCKFRL